MVIFAWYALETDYHSILLNRVLTLYKMGFFGTAHG